LAITVPSTTLSREKIDSLKAGLLADGNAVSSSLSILTSKQAALVSAELGLTSSGDTSDADVINAENYYNQQQEIYNKLLVDHEIEIANQNSLIKTYQAQYDIQNAEINGAQASLDDEKAPARAVDVAYLKAQVTISQVDLALADESYNKTLLKAPVAGVISHKVNDVGEDAQPGQKIFEMISNEKYKVDVDVPEVDVVKIKEGDKAEITLDAVPGKVFSGVIRKIYPTENIVQDVVFYNAEVVIEEDDVMIKPGMTADVEIVQAQSIDVLLIPERAVQTDDEGKKYVRVINKNMEERIYVQTGLESLDGDIEIKSGLSEGQEIVLRDLNGKK
jgi:RND family efflux transporter MFP subunit